MTKLFSELGLSGEIQKAIDKLGFEQAAPIQAAAIPPLLAGKDVVGQSQTGSGKTAAFAIPAIEKVEPSLKAVQVLVLCPTRELAIQVSEEVHKLCLFKRGIHALPIYGGQSYDRQLQGLRAGAQIVIGTPGRVMDHMERGTLRLDKTKMLILDEADVMLNMGFRDDIEFILQKVPKERQTVFFSATLPRPIQELIQKYSRDPEQIKIEQKTVTVSTVEQTYYEVNRPFKIELLTRLIDVHDLKLGIVFCNTKRMVDDLVDHLNAQGYSADRLHGDMSQAMRDRVMNKFRKSGLEFLVATDVAARGIDVDDVEVVFNYDLPYDVEDYVHRIGRTGRAGRSGRAISFVAGREVFQIRNIERFTNMRITRGKIPTPNEVEEARSTTFLTKVRTALQGEEYKQHEHLVERLMEEGFSSVDIASALLHLLQTSDGATTAGKQASADFSEGREQRGDRGDFRDRDDRGRDDRGRGNFGRGGEQWQRNENPGDRRGGRRDEAPAPARSVREKRDFKDRPAKPAAVVQPAIVKAPEAPPAPSTPPPVEAAKILHKPLPTRREEDDGSQSEVAKKASSDKKSSRKTPDGQTRLWVSLGEEQNVSRDEILKAIQGQTGLTADVFGVVDIRERHTFVDVASAHANGIVSKMNRAQIGTRKLKVKLA